MLSLIVSSASYNAALRSTAPVVQRAAAPTMKKSEALPFMEEPAHLAGMVGNVGFDPLSLSTPQNIKWMREAELKHGRMCMLASIGMVVPAFVRVPGEQFQGSYTGWEAHDRLVASGAMGQILLFVGLFETLAGIPACVATMNGDREPGDFEFGGIFKPTDPVQLRRKQNAELKNGRLAMLAFSGQVTQAVLTGHDAPFLY